MSSERTDEVTFAKQRSQSLAFSQVCDETALRSAAGAAELLLVRHGEAAPQPLFRDAGDSGGLDPPLSALGERQAVLLARSLRNKGGIARVYTSPLRRAHQTAEQVALELDVPLISLYDLREVEIRRQDVCVADEQRDSLREALRKFQQTGRWESLPFSETGQSLRTRVRRAMDSIQAASAGQRVAVVCHGGVINAYLADLFSMRPDMFFLPHNASVSCVRCLDSVGYVDALDDTAHLLGDRGNGELERGSLL